LIDQIDRSLHAKETIVGTTPRLSDNYPIIGSLTDTQQPRLKIFKRTLPFGKPGNIRRSAITTTAKTKKNYLVEIRVATCSTLDLMTSTLRVG
jgi:hypothetical protein